ncbi:MAG TPA: glycine cleavage system aminomethyltransferase GcvT [Actinomycetota bacterium]|nr:glycine cleavage system aminomethyltransferase GcvT [Actinomycetota bacterium]
MTKTSPLDAEHRALKAHMGAFGGWEMPISYAGTVAEHTAVRADAGVFDVSHLGKILVTGDGAAALLDRALSNRYTDLPEGRARYTLMLDEDGGIVDDMIVYRLDDDYLVVPNASNVDEVERRLRATDGAEAAIIERRDDAILALQGPRSRAALDAVIGDVPMLGYMHMVRIGSFGIARSGYTGEHGYEIFVPPADAPGLWRAILDQNVTPCGLAARDTLRTEMGYPLHGNDIDRDTLPAEAGLRWAIGKDKDAFAGKAAIESKEPGKTLVGITMTDRVIPRRGCAVTANGQTVGTCTSGTFSPTLKIGIALASVAPGSVKDGDAVSVEVRGKTGQGMVKKPPFVDATPR